MENVIEIEECGGRRCNELLAAGYHLIAVANKSFEANRRTQIGQQLSTFVRHDLVYAVGRYAGEPEFPASAVRQGFTAKMPVEVPAT